MEVFFVYVLFRHSFLVKTVCFSRIRTRFLRVEGEHADHLTTTKAHTLWKLLCKTKESVM